VPLSFPDHGLRKPRHTMRLLLVEDDRMIGDSLRQALRDEGYAVD
jgi:DNA-binding NtrC family response regulator